MENKLEKNISKFDQDILDFSGYKYTSSKQLSSKFSNRRITDEILLLADIKDKQVIDVGCGDGTYTEELLKGKPKMIIGIDPAGQAISHAKKGNKYKKIQYLKANIYSLDKLNRHFDVAVVRGVLHHLDDYKKAIEQLSKIADQIIVVEPNGYNVALKIIEKVSKYHREHGEKSYPPNDLDNQFKLNGCEIVLSKYCGLVPFFCPDFLAIFLKKIEPLVENTPILNKISCAVYIQKIKKCLISL